MPPLARPALPFSIPPSLPPSLSASLSLSLVLVPSLTLLLSIRSKKFMYMNLSLSLSIYIYLYPCVHDSFVRLRSSAWNLKFRSPCASSPTIEICFSSIASVQLPSVFGLVCPFHSNSSYSPSSFVFSVSS